MLEPRWAKRISQSVALFRRINAPVSIERHCQRRQQPLFISKINLPKEVLIEQGTKIYEFMNNEMWTPERTKYRVVHSHVNASKHHIWRGSAKQYSIDHTALNQATFHILSASAKRDNAVSFFVQALPVFSFSKRAILFTEKNRPCHKKCDNPQSQMNEISTNPLVRLWVCESINERDLSHEL